MGIALETIIADLTGGHARTGGQGALFILSEQLLTEVAAATVATSGNDSVSLVLRMSMNLRTIGIGQVDGDVPALRWNAAFHVHAGVWGAN